MPYSYHTQSHKLLEDIRSFYNDYNMVENYYSYNYNNFVLLFDILQFLKSSHLTCEKTLHLHYYYKNRDMFQLYYITMINYDENRFIDTTRKCRFLFGIMNPVQRTRFINDLIIEDEP
jgi:hypothetical protein